ncbi:MAG: hypothetical protein ACERK6_02295 [Candidatus Aminicenantaceae bacterium]
MKALLNLAKGFRQSAALPKLVLTLYLANLILSLLLAVPLFHALDDSMGASQVRERMAEGFDYLWWEEFRDQSQGLAETFTPDLIGKGAPLLTFESLRRGGFLGLPPMLLAMGLLYLILRSILSGGVLSIYRADKERFRLADLLQGTMAYAVRFLGILLLGWVVLLGIVGPISSWLDSLVEGAARDAVSEVGPFYLNLLVSAAILFLFLFFQMVFDYARISTVVRDRPNILRSVFSGFHFVFQHPGATLSLYGLLILLQVCVTILYVLLRSLIPQTGLIGVLSAFLLLQLFVLALVWIRCWLYSSQMYLFRFHQ